MDLMEDTMVDIMEHTVEDDPKVRDTVSVCPMMASAVETIWTKATVALDSTVTNL